MTPVSTVPSEFLDFFTLPGTYLILLGKTLNVNWQIPASDRNVNFDEVLGRVREIIITTREADKLKGIVADKDHSIHKFQLREDNSRTMSYLLTLKNLIGDNSDVVGYLAMVQETTACSVSSPILEIPKKRGNVTAEEFRTFVHKLSNPLSTIFGFAQIMSFNIEKNDPNREYVDEIFSNAERVRDILNNAQTIKHSPDRNKDKMLLERDPS